jgi:hypothetical protein
MEATPFYYARMCACVARAQVGADGAGSTVRSALEAQVQAVRCTLTFKPTYTYRREGVIAGAVYKASLV